MKASLDILRGELERLFSASGLKELCTDYFDVNPDAAGLTDDAKAVFVRRVIDWCASHHAIEALADAMQVLKKGMVDPRIKQVLGARFVRGLPEGEVVAGYKVGGRLGADGIASVHVCQPVDPAVQGKFTIWVINGELAVDASAVQRYLMMMRILRTVESKAVQKVAAVGTLPDGRPYVVLHWVDGTALSAAVPVPVLKAISIAEGVVEALEALHARGIHHADLRSENVLLCDWDAAKDVEGRFHVRLLPCLFGESAFRSDVNRRSISKTPVDVFANDCVRAPA